MQDVEASGGPGKGFTRGMEDLISFAGTLGVELVSAESEQVEGHLVWSRDKCTADGVLRGGALMAMADNFGAVCAHLTGRQGLRRAR